MNHWILAECQPWARPNAPNVNPCACQSAPRLKTTFEGEMTELSIRARTAIPTPPVTRTSAVKVTVATARSGE